MFALAAQHSGGLRSIAKAMQEEHAAMNNIPCEKHVVSGRKGGGEKEREREREGGGKEREITNERTKDSKTEKYCIN